MRKKVKNFLNKSRVWECLMYPYMYIQHLIEKKRPYRRISKKAECTPPCPIGPLAKRNLDIAAED